MIQSEVKKRYIFTSMGASLGYLGAVFGVAFIHDKFIDGSLPAIIISMIPGIFICVIIWSVWQYIKDIDEVARHDLTQAMLIGLFVLLALSGGWGLVELFNDDMPRLPIFSAFPVFFLIFGLVSGLKYKRWC